ncbi:hypothetical protein TcCL_Unassigned03870 [Trypanosoma cruzi]|nr:hypothetical protein TcCL_Unassigned03870 [Trypanosoma cruzi]
MSKERIPRTAAQHHTGATPSTPSAAGVRRSAASLNPRLRIVPQGGALRLAAERHTNRFTPLGKGFLFSRWRHFLPAHWSRRTTLLRSPLVRILQIQTGALTTRGATDCGLTISGFSAKTLSVVRGTSGQHSWPVWRRVNSTRSTNPTRQRKLVRAYPPKELPVKRRIHIQ